MPLASQSPRSNRQFKPSQRTGSQFILIGAAAVASLGAGWWLMRAEAGHEDGLGAKANPSTPTALASSVPGTSVGGDSTANGSTLDAVVADAARDARERDVREAREFERAAAAANATPVVRAEDVSIEAADDARTAPQSSPTTSPATPAAPTNPPAATPSAEPSARPNTEPSTPPSDAAAPPKRGNGISADDRTPAPPAAAVAGSSAANLAQGLGLAASEPVKSRTLLSAALLSGELSPLDAKHASDALVEIGRALVFTPVYNANDPMFFQYTVQSGDSLEKIVRRHKIGCDWRLVQRLNNIKKPEAIRVGQRLKLPKGPFSAVVSKRDYRVDICVGAGAERVVITSLPCGLGSANGTPTGNFKVRPGSKLLNPQWTHPVTGEFYGSDDPNNPIGEYWLGIEGTDETNSQLAGYGIHGTIDVDSIGQDRSLGCVRLLADDVAIVWECLGDGAPVEIRK